MGRGDRIPKCGQKLILKGRVLADDAEALKGGTKVMVVGTSATPVGTAEAVIATALGDLTALEADARKKGKVSLVAVKAAEDIAARVAALTLPPSATAQDAKRADIIARCKTLGGAEDVVRVKESMQLPATQTTFKFAPSAGNDA